MRISLSPGGQTTFRTEKPADEILVATEDGIVALKRDSAPDCWRTADRFLQGQRVSSLLIDIRPRLLVAGTHDAGVFVSEDDGETWEQRNRGLDVTAIYCMASNDVGGHPRLYAGTEPAHLYVSDDLGGSWTELNGLREVPSAARWNFNSITYAHVKHIGFDPRSAERLYVSVEVGGAYRSDDGGRSWQELEGMDADVHRMIPMPTDPDRVYLAARDGIWRSSDAGDSWRQLTDSSARVGYPDAMVANPDEPDLVFIAGAYALPRAWRVSGDCDSAIVRSRDGGGSWQELCDGLPSHIKANIEAMSLSVWPGGCGVIAASLDGDLFSSLDAGDHWTTIAAGLPTISKNGRPYSTGPGREAAIAQS